MDYIQRVRQAIAYIENNLEQKIFLEEIAKEACFSKYHFLRIFQAIVGDTAGNYLRKRRLTKASYDLIYTAMPLFDIAIKYQFESQQAFTRAFKNFFGISPGIYRRENISKYMMECKELDEDRFNHISNSITLKPSYSEFSGCKLIGMETKTSMQENRISKLWADFFPRMKEIQNLTGKQQAFEFRKPDPNFELSEFTVETEFTEMAGLPVTSFDFIPEGMVKFEIPAGRYAVFTHLGKTQDLYKTYEYIWSVWLPCSQEEVDMRFDFELYDKRFLGPENPDSQIDIYIPIK